MRLAPILIATILYCSVAAPSIAGPPLSSGDALTAAAQAAEAAGNIPKALTYYQTILKRLPGGVYAARALRATAVLQINKLNDPEAACKTDQQLLSQLPEADPAVTYQAAMDLIAQSDKLKRPELKCQAYSVMLKVLTGSPNRSSWYLGLVQCAVSAGDQTAASNLVDRMFAECSNEPGFRSNAEALIPVLRAASAFHGLADGTQRRLTALPDTPDPAAAAFAQYQMLAAAKDYKGAIAQAQAMAIAYPQDSYTTQALINAQGYAESPLKDWMLNRDLCRLAAMSMKGPDESGNLHLALLYWVRACGFLKDVPGADEAANYAFAHFPTCSATQGVMMQALTAHCQNPSFWMDPAEMKKAIEQARFILKHYPHGTAELQTRWLEAHFIKMIAIDKRGDR